MTASVDPSGHAPVLPDEIVELLQPEPGQTYVDLTMGRGGHAAMMAEILGPTGTIVGCDLDASNLAFARERLESPPDAPTVHTFHGNFADAPGFLRQQGIVADMMLADLGFASTQIDDASRGFSFRRDGPLDMRLDADHGRVTAAMIVNESSEQELVDLIFRYGEEPLARKIARAILEAREERPILQTARLAQLVRSVYGRRARTSRVDPATRVFMALRIATNDELGSLERLWESISRTVAAGLHDPADVSPDHGVPGDASADGRHDPADSFSGGWFRLGARLAVISFHSLEDRICKRAIADLVSRDMASRLTRKPIVATQDEVARNPRSRSAKMRAVRLGGERSSL